MTPSKATFPERIRNAADFALFIGAMLAPNPEPFPVPLLLAVGVDDEKLLCGFGIQNDARTVADLRFDGLLLLAEELGAEALLLAHVLPPGSRAPGVRAARQFAMLAEEGDRAGLLLVDCVVVRGDEWWSLRSLAAG